MRVVTFSNVMESASCPCCHDPLDPATCVRLPCLHQLCPLCLADMDDVNACCPVPVEPQLSCGTPFRKEDVYQPAPIPPKKRCVKRQHWEQLEDSRVDSTEDLFVVELGITLVDERLANMAVHAAKLIALVDEKEAAQRQGSPSAVALRAQIATEMNADLKTVEQWRDTLLVARAHCKEIVAALSSALDGLEVVPMKRLLDHAKANRANLVKLSVPSMFNTWSPDYGTGWIERRLYPPYQRSLLVNFQKEDSQGIVGSTSRSRDYATLPGSKPVRVIGFDVFQPNEHDAKAPPAFGLLPDGKLVVLEEDCLHILTPEGASFHKIFFEPLSIHGAASMAVASGGGGVIWIMAEESVCLLSPTGQQISCFSPIQNWGEVYVEGIPLEDGTMLLVQDSTSSMMFLYTHDGVHLWKGTDDLGIARKFCRTARNYLPMVVRDKELWFVDRTLDMCTTVFAIRPELSILFQLETQYEPFVFQNGSRTQLLGVTFDPVGRALIVATKNKTVRLSVWTPAGGLVFRATDCAIPSSSDQFGRFQLLHVPGSRGELYCWDPFRRRILVY